VSHAECDSHCESRRPLRATFRAEFTRHAGCELRWLQALGEDIGELIGGLSLSLSLSLGQLIVGVHPYEANVAILDQLVREMLPNVGVLCTLASPDDVVAAFDAGVVILMNRSPSVGVESHADE
jgi:hypothetical protein